MDMLAKMMRVQKHASEMWIDYHIRKRQCCKAWLSQYSEFWSEVDLKKHFCWMGHVARLPQDRPAAQSLRHESMEWKRQGLRSHKFGVYKKDFMWRAQGVHRATNAIAERRIDSFLQRFWLLPKIWWEEAQNRENWKCSCLEFVRYWRVPYSTKLLQPWYLCEELHHAGEVQVWGGQLVEFADDCILDP